MSEEIVLYHNPMSRGRIALWMMEEVGVPYRVELLEFEKQQQKSPEYMRLNPMGKIPTLVHNGTVVTEAAAICAYLADAFPATNLAPATSDPARGTYLRWFFFAANCLEAAVVDRMFNRPPVERKGAIGYGSYEDALGTLESAAIAPGPFILGERFSAADVYIASAIGWGLMTKAIEPRPAFLAYTARATDRPAFKRANEKNNAFAAQLKG
jgi:glutathione S-transferase